MKNRVVVTGIACISPLGNDIKTVKENVFSGRSGIKHTSLPYADKLKCKISAQVDYDPAQHYDKKSDYIYMDRFSQMALSATKLAVEDAALSDEEIALADTGVFYGTGMGGIHAVEAGYTDLFLDNKRNVTPYTVLRSMYNNAAAMIAKRYKVNGPNVTYTTACSSSAVAIGEAYNRIKLGEQNVMIAGGSDSILAYASIKAWEIIRILAVEDSTDPAKSCKPFSADRTGLVIGEGAATLILESYEHAKKRGAKIYGELVGYGLANDYADMAKPSVDGQKRPMQLALKNANLNPNEIQYINAHGTGTRDNDKTETEAIKQVFEDSAYQLAVSSTKAMHGHLMGAAGALEAIITLMAINNQKLPPTINLDNADLDCDLDYVANTTRACDIEYAMSNSFAFGGPAVSLIFKRVD